MNKNIGLVKYIIFFCIIIYILQNFFSSAFTDLFALYYIENPSYRPWQFITHVFLHSEANIMHIVFNMYALWSFGAPLEQRWGSKTFILFFLVAGLGAGGIYSLVNYMQYQQLIETYIQSGATLATINDFLNNPLITHALLQHLSEEQARELLINYHSSAVGASGAIYGILAAFALNFPKVKMFLIFLPFPIAAMYFMPMLIGFDLFFGLTSYSVGNIAHFAHIGGAIIGFLLALFIWFKNKTRNEHNYQLEEE